MSNVLGGLNCDGRKHSMVVQLCIVRYKGIYNSQKQDEYIAKKTELLPLLKSLQFLYLLSIYLIMAIEKNIQALAVLAGSVLSGMQPQMHGISF